MKPLLPFLSVCAGLILLSGCATTTTAARSGGSYHVTAYKPHNPNAVTVKVSTSTQHIYVMEGDRCLMAVQGCVGEHGETHPGHFTVINKNRSKRSGTFGFDRNGNGADAHKGQSVAVGYPMGFWVEWASGYGF